MSTRVVKPVLVIAGTGSGVGKTSLALGLARELTRRGLRVQTFKVGPDFLDPTWLAMASSRTCYNLDGWMTSRPYVRQLFARATADADIAIVEGVMGMFDGASASSLAGSTAEIARWLNAPVILVAGVHGMARSLAAVVKGFAEFEPGVRVAGVIANQGGSGRHRATLAEALAAARLPPLVGLVPRGALPPLASRHLGLVTADPSGMDSATMDRLADACREHLDVELLLRLARSAKTGGVEDEGDDESAGGEWPVPRVQPLRLGIARDEAFHFYYPDNLEMFQRCGIELVSFSPLADAALPGDLDGLYFGGGYPEVCAERLAANRPMLDDVRQFAASGRAIYAECGGLMYLGRSLATLDGRRFPMTGILPIDTAMLPKLKVLGYTEVTFATDSLWGAAGQSCRGHEFHYSEITASDAAAEGWQPAYTIRRRTGAEVASGFTQGRILAGYVHLHWASRPEIARHFLQALAPAGACCCKGPA